MGAGSIAAILFGAATVGYVTGSKKRVDREHAGFCEADVMLKDYNARLKDSKLDQSMAETKLSINRALEEAQRVRMQILNDRLKDLESDLSMKSSLLELLSKEGGELK